MNCYNQVYVVVGGSTYIESGELADTETLTVGDASWTTLTYKFPKQILGMASVSLDNKVFIMGRFDLKRI